MLGVNLVLLLSVFYFGLVKSQSSQISFSSNYDFFGNCETNTSSTIFNASDLSLPLVYYCIYGYQLQSGTYNIDLIDSSNNVFYTFDTDFVVSQDEYVVRFYVGLDMLDGYTGDQTFTLRFSGGGDVLASSFTLNGLKDMTIEDTSVRVTEPDSISDYYNATNGDIVYQNGDSFMVGIDEELFICSVASNFKDYFYFIFIIKGLNSDNELVLYQRIATSNTDYFDHLFCKGVTFSGYFLNDTSITIQTLLRFDTQINVDELTISLGIEFPTPSPTIETAPPTNEPTSDPTMIPTQTPTNRPSISPTSEPTSKPSDQPSESPTNVPTISPTNPGYCIHKNGKSVSVCSSQTVQSACVSVKNCQWIQ